MKDETDAALKNRWEAEFSGKAYKERFKQPNWSEIENSVRADVLVKLGLPPKITTIFATDDSIDDAGADDGAAEGVVAREEAFPPLNDAHFRPMDVPHKWLRIDLSPEEIPLLEFDPSLSRANLIDIVDQASAELTRALGDAIKRWAESALGKAWCYRKGVRVLPSQYKGWETFLESVRADATKTLALPDITLRWQVRIVPDWSDPSRSNLHISLENASAEPKRNDDTVDQSVFRVHLDVSMPVAMHRSLRLGRVEPSYRYNEYLDYPAMGFNGGVQRVQCGASAELRIRTTWAPRYTQPRVIPRQYPGLQPNMRLLSGENSLASVLPLVDVLEDWYASLDKRVDPFAGLSADDEAGRARETSGFAKDKRGWRKEIDAVRAGLEILTESERVWKLTRKRGRQSDERATVFEAWLSMNETMADLLRSRFKNDEGEWRLFQLAFVIAHIPSIASRMDSFASRYERERDDTVTLLYFATGGGKSEAFFGLLVLALFLDRLRGKAVGVTAMIRYPLRLLTIQQAQRCSKVLAKAELVRRRHEIGGGPFSIGFWVGSGGSPNNHFAPGVADIPDIKDQSADLKTESALLGREINYELQKAAWNKIPSCPFCGEETVLRRFSTLGGTVAHVCSSLDCAANEGEFRPLPFFICDVDIYDIAPSVLLGTVDKLALIGQSSRTIRKIYAMFGAAPWQENATGRLRIPNEPRAFEEGPEAAGCVGLFPAYPNGKRLFHDPFPSLLIQDEAHLLDESLGTFAGLFESALDAVYGELSKPLKQLVAHEPGGQTRRRSKVVAASATVSDPDRQLEHLYQRPVPAMQFPYPGESLYASFYAAPAEPTDLRRSSLPDIEQRANWARVYVGFMTNGRAHTATTVAVLSNFHAAISELILSFTSDDERRHQAAREMLVGAVSEGEMKGSYSEALRKATPAELATLVDLHRIALTYVTNKKGGDQIMAAEFEETRKRHVERNLPLRDLRTDLITGSVSQGDIQKTVQDAQRRPKPGEPFPDLETVLRSVIATSAVSHGVDVEEFNSMFFAGLPSDIAEYIQASSRVGRTHVGFVVLVPTPQRRRDRYVVEVFDSYHRFLERMVSPAAIDRWAGRAVERVLPSLIQAYLAGVAYVSEVHAAPADKKHSVRDLSWIPNIVSLYNGHATRGPLVANLCGFVEKAIGLDNETFAPGGKQHYQELIKDRVEAMLTGWARDMLGEHRGLGDYFRAQSSVMKRPMTSLRDVDEAGFISFGYRDLDGARGKIDDRAARRVMKLIRGGVADGGNDGE
ncbi:helicase-related protein [Rudaea cellulosilytica]|uniref:helicase-related protein n=1 Tax=Rudaea cellulosilytica TaxID=540746 RepID=UPI000382E6A8|nr:helicase-related protein [Rudaea cellulosilytica]